MKKKENLRELSAGELKKKLDDLRHDMVRNRVLRANQQLKNPLKLREVRRQIARVLTIIREKGEK